MNGRDFAKLRKHQSRTQEQTALGLGVSQAYLSLLENGKRQFTGQLQNRAVRFLSLPVTELTLLAETGVVENVSDARLAAEVAGLGYPGFSHLRKAPRRNPGDILLSGLNAPNRGTRLVEAFPWLAAKFPTLNWSCIMRAAKAHDLQNRLGFVLDLAAKVTDLRNDHASTRHLLQLENELFKSRLAREDTLCNEAMTVAERRWLKTNRTKAAKRWNLLTDLSAEHLKSDV